MAGKRKASTPPAATTPTEEDIKALIEPSVVAKASEVAEAVFKQKLEEASAGIKRDINDTVDRKLSSLTIGIAFATLLVILVILVDSHFFKASYNQSFVQSQQGYAQEMRELRKENADKMAEQQRAFDAMKERTDFIERLLLQRGTETIAQPVEPTKK